MQAHTLNFSGYKGMQQHKYDPPKSIGLTYAAGSVHMVPSIGLIHKASVDDKGHIFLPMF